MIRKHEDSAEQQDVWGRLAAPLSAEAISWRQDGRPMQRDGKYFARFVAYVDANTVRERLDAVVPGEWDSTLELLPPLMATGGDGEANEEPCAFKCRLSIRGTIREDVGTGRDYKTAATDAFKRAGVRFGIAHELYDYEQNWVQVDGDGKYAKPLEDPGAAYARRIARKAERSGKRSGERALGVVDGGATKPATAASEPATEPATEPSGPLASDEPACPKCGGRMWDSRLSKRNPKAPDYKCRSRSCDGVIWPPKKEYQQEDITHTPADRAKAAPASDPPEQSDEELRALLSDGDDGLPF